MRREDLLEDFAGNATFTGFKIEYEGDIFHCSGPNMWISPRMFFIKRVCLFVLLCLWICYFYLKSIRIIFQWSLHPLFFHIGFIVLTISSFFFASTSGEKFQRKEGAEWHGCEHMALQLLAAHLAEGLEINLENLKKMPRFSEDCNSKSWATIMAIAIGLFFSIHLIENLGLLIGGLFTFVLLVVCFWSGRTYLNKALQYFVTTANPSADKLEITVHFLKEVAEKIRKKYPYFRE